MFGQVHVKKKKKNHLKNNNHTVRYDDLTREQFCLNKKKKTLYYRVFILQDITGRTNNNNSIYRMSKKQNTDRMIIDHKILRAKGIISTRIIDGNFRSTKKKKPSGQFFYLSINRFGRGLIINRSYTNGTLLENNLAFRRIKFFRALFTHTGESGASYRLQ